MLLLKNSKVLKASSLVESVIAISIISTCALVAFLVYLNIIKQNRSIHYYEAKHVVDFLTFESAKEKDYDDDFFEFKNYTITKNVVVNTNEQVVFLFFLVKTVNKEYKINKLIPYYE